MDRGDPDRDADERRRARRAARRRAVRRRRTVALAALAAAVAIGVTAFGGGSGTHPGTVANGGRAAPGRSATGARSPATQARAAGTSVAQRASAPPPGSLPQTHAFPSATTAAFRAAMASLWAGVVHDSVTRALPAFFPRGAYLQLKTIADAGSDWSGRLVHDYGLDLTAAHRLLGRDAARARLVGVNVVSSYGHWVPPGVCDNSIGYYEMPNARVVYGEDGQERSFGIASMISWRGAWYVVHLGAILRATDTGQVDAPAAGPGASAYSGTC